MQPAPPPRLDTPSFTLRTWADTDAPKLRVVLDTSDAHLRAWIPWVVDGRVPGQSLDERLHRHAQAFETGTEWVYGMFSVDEREVLGGCGLYPRVGPGAIEIGYWLSVNHTGRGLATSAAAELTRVAFAANDIERVEIHCARGNVASNRVPQRLGYRVVSQNDVRTDEDASDRLLIWQLTREEFGVGEQLGGVAAS